MTDELSRAIARIAMLEDQFGLLAERHNAVEQYLGAQESAALEARLSPGSLVLGPTGVDTAGAPQGLTDMSLQSRLRDDASIVGYTTGGRIDQFSGRGNLLRDPTFEGLLQSTLLTGSFASVGNYWEARRTTTGSGTPSATVICNSGGRAAGVTGRSSSFVQLKANWALTTGSPVSITIDFQQTGVSVSDASPWLVAAVRVGGWASGAFLTGVLDGSITIAICNAGGTVLVQSDPLIVSQNLEDVEGLISVALANPGVGTSYTIRVTAVISGASVGAPGLNEIIYLSEMHVDQSDTEDPPSFSPAIGTWQPGGLVSVNFNTGSLIDSSDTVTGNLMYILTAAGAQTWYDESAGTIMYANDPRGGDFQPGMFPVSCSADSSTNSSTPSDIDPGGTFNFPVRAGRSYAFQITFRYEVGLNTQGCDVGIRHPGGVATADCITELNTTAGTGSRAFQRISGGAATDIMTNVGAAAVATTQLVITMQGVYTCGVDGTFQFRFSRAGASSSPGATIKAGSGGVIIASPI